jgi:hypothetical protein
VHYIHENLRKILIEKFVGQKSEMVFESEKSYEQEIDDLGACVFAGENKEMNIKALLLQVFNHALHGRYEKAKTLFLLSD